MFFLSNDVVFVTHKLWLLKKKKKEKEKDHKKYVGHKTTRGGYLQPKWGQFIFNQKRESEKKKKKKKKGKTENKQEGKIIQTFKK